MSQAKEFYRSYTADDNLGDLNIKLSELILDMAPAHALEFGCGSGKNLKLLKGIATAGIDVSFVNVIRAASKNELPFVMLGDETNLRHLCNFDVVFTVSVLDHIEHIGPIVDEFKRIANRAVFLAETNDQPGLHYFPHSYEKMGFTKLDYCWKSDGDGGKYYIWKWLK